jgi:hypothetical protein
MVLLNDLVQVHNDVLNRNECRLLIDTFESANELENIDNNGTPKFTQYNLTKNLESHNSQVKYLHNKLVKIVVNQRDQYYKFIDKRCFPEKHAFEQFRIKKYQNNNEDRFDTHVDVTDYESARRFLSFFWYLNTVDEGGETEFDDLTIKPRMGNMVVFPPLWMFPHRGNKPISGDKYLLSTYLHYV